MTDAHQSPSSSHIAIYFTVFLTNLHISFLQRHQLLYKYILDDKIWRDFFLQIDTNTMLTRYATFTIYTLFPRGRNIPYF